MTFDSFKKFSSLSLLNTSGGAGGGTWTQCNDATNSCNEHPDTQHTCSRDDGSDSVTWVTVHEDRPVVVCA